MKTTRERTLEKILASATRLLEQVQEMNPNGVRYPLKAEFCEAEFRDALALAPSDPRAVLGLAELFYEYQSRGASEEAVELLTKALEGAPKNKDLKAWLRKHARVVKREQ